VTESKKDSKQRVLKIIELLSEEFPNSQCSLNFSSPLELLIATILSAQCTDERVNKVTPDLFSKYKTAKDYANALPAELAEDIRSTGFFNQKTRSIQRCCRIITDEYNGKVPRTMEELTRLHGVGRKTANVLLGNAFNTPGIVVDTHVKRLAGRLGLSEKKDPDKIEKDLNDIVPQEEWTHFSHLLVDLGRKYCKAKKPHCTDCPINKQCPSCELPFR